MSNPFELAFQIDRLMRRIQAGLHPQAMEFDVERVGPFGGMVIMALNEHQPVSVLALGHALGRDKAQMTRTIQMLERKEMVVRETSESDGRVSLIRLTDKGAAFAVEIQRVLTTVLDDVLQPLSNQNRTQFEAALKSL